MLTGCASQMPHPSVASCGISALPTISIR
ncbi:hypothetical protein KMS41_13460 [Ochrobactrum sp. BTU1]|nr:hypothetical protein KMS41_13460 [Ochrobactrum sp. BTU1]